MAYNNFQNCTLEEYENIIYSQDTQNELKISFGGVDLQFADLHCEKIKLTSRVTTSSKNAFSFSNFIAKEMEITLHDIDESILQDPVIVDLGTNVNNQIEYVRMGVFYIQDTPTTDKGKVTIKLRDGAVKFDFGYNAKPFMDEHEGKATLRQLLDDICLQAGIDNNIESFPNQDLETGFYDNTIKARAYISYIAEQAGMFATMNRNDELIFVNLENPHVWFIPLDVVEKYTIGEPYDIQRVVYESGTIKYETNDNQDVNTLYINGANPYVMNKDQVDMIFGKYTSFWIDSATTGKILGNPAIDPYDIICVVDTENDEMIFKTIANNVLTYSGVFTNTFDTQIGIEQRKENVTISGEATFKKWAKTEIDNVNATVTTITTNVEELSDDVNKSLENIKAQYQYELTKDKTYQRDKTYYVYNSSENKYEAFESYSVGDTIPENTIYEYIKIKDSIEDSLNSKYNELLDRFTQYTPTSQLDSIINKVVQEQTDTYTKTEIQQIANGTGVDGVKVTAVISTEATFDKDGMHYAKTGAKTNSTINQDGLEVDGVGNEGVYLYAGYVEQNDNRFNTSTRTFNGSSIVYTRNLKTTGDTIIGNHCLIMDYEDDGYQGTGWFNI